MIRPYRSIVPSVHPSVWVADGAHVIGDVHLGEDASVWFGAVLRGDVNIIRVGRGTNIQDGTIVHVNRHGTPAILGDYVTVGHAARLHGCAIASHCLIGIGAIVLDGAEVGEECVIAAGALVAPGSKIPSRSMVSADDLDLIRRSAEGYITLKNDYLAAGRVG